MNSLWWHCRVQFRKMENGCVSNVVCCLPAHESPIIWRQSTNPLIRCYHHQAKTVLCLVCDRVASGQARQQEWIDIPSGAIFLSATDTKIRTVKWMKRTDGASGSDGGSHKSTIIEQRRSYESTHTYCGRQNCSTLYFGANGYVLGADSLALMRRCAVSMTNIRYVLFDTIFFGHFEEFMVSNDCRPCNTDTYVCASWSTAHCTGTQTQQLIALPPERRRYQRRRRQQQQQNQSFDTFTMLLYSV